MTHPRLPEAERKLMHLGRHIGCRLSRRQKRQYRAMFDEAMQKHESGLQAVRLVDDLIEQNRPLKW
ncbi:hypothetical protein I6F34_01215 [Bradyrhizobium sp. BRP05]|nr:hypothetical protein [Bradyrhizobium sp. BRP05]